MINIGGAPGFEVRPEEVFTQASAIKIPILWALHRAAEEGELSLDEALSVDPRDGAGGCGVLQSFSSPETRIALGDLAVMMTVLSDNVATNLLIERLGFEAVNELIEDSHGGANTRLRRKMIDQAARDAGRENTATPRDAAVLMLRLAEHCEAGDPAALRVKEMLELKKESPVTAALPGEVRLATKPGMLEGLRTEWSIIEQVVDDRLVHYSVAIMADGADDSELEPLFRKLALAIHHRQTGEA
ncbi:hypothetical protein MalM25_15510 [Planctomycetes bacterium MalM25]|nr:hypothetical protein MalM25_15510 [Planctomycetes bacterium MalM25]